VTQPAPPSEHRVGVSGTETISRALHPLKTVQERQAAALPEGDEAPE
jgi:hypothetical protein